MNIDLSKLLSMWYENEKGEVVSKDSPDARTYHSIFPCQIQHEISGYYPNDKEGNIFRPMVTFTTTYCKQGQDCIVAMVNSGDYTLAEAIRVYTTACERCSNVLIHKYLKDDGYEEHSAERYKAGTRCVFCNDDELDMSYQAYLTANNTTDEELFPSKYHHVDDAYADYIVGVESSPEREAVHKIINTLLESETLNGES